MLLLKCNSMEQFLMKLLLMKMLFDVNAFYGISIVESIRCKCFLCKFLVPHQSHLPLLGKDSAAWHGGKHTCTMWQHGNLSIQATTCRAEWCMVALAMHQMAGSVRQRQSCRLEGCFEEDYVWGASPCIATCVSPGHCMVIPGELWHSLSHSPVLLLTASCESCCDKEWEVIRYSDIQTKGMNFPSGLLCVEILNNWVLRSCGSWVEQCCRQFALALARCIRLWGITRHYWLLSSADLVSSKDQSAVL